MRVKCDFSGWATKNNVRCSDGRTILQNAFAENDGKKVPLVWQHQHNSLENVIGHAILENRREGVYAYCNLNDTYMGQNAKELVAHGDITCLSIFANQLKQNNGDVIHGNIRELSLVLAGANPEAIIENLSLAHSEDGEYSEAIIFPEDDFDKMNLHLSHEDEEGEVEEENEDYVVDEDDEEDDPFEDDEDDEDDPFEDEEYEDDDEDPFEDDEEDEDIEHSDLNIEDVLDTMDDVQRYAVEYMVDKALNAEEIAHAEDANIADVIDTMTSQQKKVLYYLIEKALNNGVAHSDFEEDYTMKQNVFDNVDYEAEETLKHDALNEMIADARDNRTSLKQTFLAHAEDYGIDHIDYLFPDYKKIADKPDFIARNQDWVAKVMGGVKHVPWSRIKSVHADITGDEARAKGYVKGNLKLEEVFDLLKRTTDPQTIYKKQKMDRDDITDITDFDVVAWLKTEMRVMLNEEIARAILVGDGRSTLSPDKIKADHVRPVWGDNSLYTINKTINQNGRTADQKLDDFITAVVKARKDYKGSGNLTLFTTEDMLTDLLLLKDTIGHRLYKNTQELATALRVTDIVTVPVMENLTRTASGVTYTLAAILLNFSDYSVGCDKGGAIDMFEDFDIDYNQEKYLMETRISGALTKPYSAITVETYSSAQ